MTPQKTKKLDLIKFAEGLSYTEINDDTLLELLDALTKANGNPSPKLLQ